MFASKNQVFPEDFSCIIQPSNNKGGLYIGNLQAAQNINTLKKLNIKALLTAAKGIQINHPRSQIPYFLYVPADDHESFDLSKYFHQGANFINDCLQKTNIMVHCMAGVSRSVSLSLAYLIKFCKMSYNKAYDFIKSKRRIIHPNDGFISQLKRFERQFPISNSPPRLIHSLSSSPMKYSKISPSKYNSPYLQANKYKQIPENNYFKKQQTKYNYSQYITYNNQQRQQNTTNLVKNEKLDINSILSKYQYFTSKDKSRNYQNPEQSKIRNSYKEQPIYNRIKRISSMNVGNQQKQISSIYRSRNNIYENSSHPFSNIQNRQMTDIDKKIEQIRKKYHQYQITPSTLAYSKFTRTYQDEENNYRTRQTINQKYTNKSEFQRPQTSYGGLRSKIN